MNCSLIFEKTTDYNKAKVVHFKAFWKNGTFQEASTFYYICLPKRAKEIEVEYSKIQDVQIWYELRTKGLDVKVFITNIENETDNKAKQFYQYIKNYDPFTKITLEKINENFKKLNEVNEIKKILNERLNKLNDTLKLDASEKTFEEFKNKKFWLNQALIILEEIIKEGAK